MTDNSINDKYKIPYEKFLQMRVENNNFTWKIGQGKPTITTLHDITFNEKLGDYVYSNERFNIISIGLFIECTLSESNNITNIFFIGGWYYYAELVNNQIRCWSPENNSSFISYSPGDKYIQYYDGKNVTFYLNGSEIASYSIVTPAPIKDYLWFGYDENRNTENTINITNINCYTLGNIGNNGLNVFTILNDTGIPSNSVGEAGDFYINNVANTMYGRKEGLSGSLFFGGVAGTGSYLSVPADIDFVLDIYNFTIEWFQYLKNHLPYGRVFSMNSTFIGVSIEYNNPDGTQTLIFWVNGISRGIYNFNFLDKWVHIALVRNGDVFIVYLNGTNVYTWNNFRYIITNLGHDLLIGNEEGDSDTGGFKGFITNFRWVKGEVVYTDNFIVPTEPLTSVTGTKLLLNATNYSNYIVDSSGLNKTVTNHNTVVSWDPWTPFISTGNWSTNFAPIQLNDPQPHIISLSDSNNLLWDFDANGFSSIIIFISCSNDLTQAPQQIAQVLVNVGSEGVKTNRLGSLPTGVTVFSSGGNKVYLYSANPYSNISTRIVPIV